MPAVTTQQLEDAGADVTTIGKFTNDAADVANPGQANGTLTNRVGLTFKNLANIVASLLASVSAAATSASNAGTSATAAGTSATNAATSEGAALTSKNNAAANEALVQAYWTNIGFSVPPDTNRRLVDVEGVIDRATLAYSMVVYEQNRANELERRLAAVESGSVASWIVAARIEQHGWQVEIDVALARAGGTFDKTKIAITVYDMGFDENGQPVIRPRTLVPTRVCRKPYPNQAQNDEVAGTYDTWTLSLPKQVFAKAKAGTGNSGFDPIIAVQSGWYTVSATAGPAQALLMTNNSTEAYPKPVFRNALPPYRLIGATGRFEVTGNALHVMESRTAAACKLTLTGQTSGIVKTYTSKAMVASNAYTKRTCASPVFSVQPDMSAYTQAEKVKEDWAIYPFIGDATSVLYSSVGSYAAGDFASHFHVVNKTGAYAKVYAVVDPVSGSDTTGAASTVSEATAAATPFLTEKKAVYAAQLLNNSANGRNNVGGVEICFVDGIAHKLTMPKTDFNIPSVGFAAEDAFVGDTWCVYRPVTGATNCSLIQDSAVIGGRCVPRRTWLKDFKEFNLRVVTTGNPILIDGGEANDGSFGQEIWIDNCPIVDGGITNTSVAFYRCGKVFMTNCANTCGGTFALSYGNVRHAIMLMRDTVFTGTSKSVPSIIFAMIGVAIANIQIGLNLNSPSNTNMLLPHDGVVWAGVEVRSLGYNSTGMVSLSSGGTITKGFAMLNVLLESANTSQPSLHIHGDAINFNIQNVFMDYVTIVGGRLNIGYEDSFTMTDSGDPEQQLKKLLILRRSVLRESNTKTDLFQNVGARIHTWNVAHHVGWEYVRRLEADSAGGTGPGNGSWSGEAWTNTEVYIGPDARAQFTNYQADHRSPAVTGAGSGNYMPTSTSVLLNIVPEAERACPVDIVGNARSGEVGAYAYAA